MKLVGRYLLVLLQPSLKLANLIWSKFTYDWTKNCYLEKTPFKDDEGTHQVPSQAPKKLDQDLDKYKIRGTHMVPEVLPCRTPWYNHLQDDLRIHQRRWQLPVQGTFYLIYGTQNRHLNVRTEVVQYLELHQDM